MSNLGELSAGFTRMTVEGRPQKGMVEQKPKKQSKDDNEPRYICSLLTQLF
jgi:hypothetical protein